MLQHVDSVIKTVRKALCDPLPEVRACAAITFNNLYKTIGVKALNDIIPDLLEKLVNINLQLLASDNHVQPSITCRCDLNYISSMSRLTQSFMKTHWMDFGKLCLFGVKKFCLL